MIGERLGNWVIDKELGRGGMGHVYLAHEELDRAEARASTRADMEGAGPRQAAIKVLASELAVEPGFKNRFAREIASISTLQHPNIVGFYESGEYQSRQYYVMEYIEGQSFEELLRERGRLPWEQLVLLTIQVCGALKHAHDHGIVHRDIKPSNLLVTRDGVVKLADFGVAKVFATPRLTATQAVVGTAEYMSPEQASGKPVTRRSDLYSLGVVMYAMLTGRPPFRAESVPDMLQKHRFGRFDAPKVIVPELPPELDAIVCQLLEKDPDQRPADALVLRRQLEQLQQKIVRKDRQTLDEQHTKTVALGAASPQAGEDAGEGVGPATLFSKLMRAELEALNRAGPIGRLLNRGWVLLLLLLVTVCLFVWGLWPKSPEALLHAADQSAAKRQWYDVEDSLDRLERKYPDHPYGERVAELRQAIEKNRPRRGSALADLAKLVDVFAIPKSDAEQFYLEGVRAYRNGNPEQARKIWESVRTAFADVKSERQWVELADAAVKDPARTQAAEEAVQQAEKEPPEQALRRLQALEELYRDRPGPEAKAVRERIATALNRLQANEKSPRGGPP